ncbi:histidine phosphatase superfamily domain-containing protein [Rhizoctonia solani AG-1 IA]|uniref:Histidine phosphatase superfamily domain-containing protein n=1 Tax=Thanatephorus cucumeris (strain AG1-IA) TaxID=983506 RepID=L8WJS5_THACA|nr:histidine phosphatase superfamily domain-containing protein [Rhizoctonia solani AG-1 IA]
MPAWRRIATLVRLSSTDTRLHSTMITLTFVRHGERNPFGQDGQTLHSLITVRRLYSTGTRPKLIHINAISRAQCKRAWLRIYPNTIASNVFTQQAKAAGKFFSTYRITHMFASDLKRAHSTAQAIYDTQPDPKPPLTITDLLREQHFGEGEGKPWGQAKWDQPQGRDGKFSGGESLNDVARRGDRFYETYLAPIIKEAVGKAAGEVNVVVVSHGICIAETLGALSRRCVEVDTNGWSGKFRGLNNTAWTRVSIGLDGETLDEAPPSNGAESNHRLTPDPGAQIATKLEESAPPPEKCEETGPPSLRMKIIACNQHSHLNGVLLIQVRQQDGNQSSGDDPNQKRLREFFGGGGEAD